MLYVIKLGPVTVGTGDTNVYIGFGDTAILRPVTGHDDEQALRILARQAPGENLRCEPQLAAAGKALGFFPAPLPYRVIPQRAMCALQAALGTLSKGIETPALALLMEASAEFWQAQPWRFWGDSEALRVTVSGALNYELEGAIMGQGGAEFGIALYHGEGSIARMATLMTFGMASAIAENGYALTLNDEPAFAAAAIDDAYLLPRVPGPMRMEKGRPVAPRSLEILLLAGALRAAAKLTSANLTASREVKLGRNRIAVTIQAPAPINNRKQI